MRYISVKRALSYIFLKNFNFHQLKSPNLKHDPSNIQLKVAAAELIVPITDTIFGSIGADYTNFRA